MKKLGLLLMLLLLTTIALAEASFTPIFCNDYDFTGCFGEIEKTNEVITDESAWVCPEWAEQCEITTEVGDEEWLIGSGNCHLDTGDLCDGWVCDVERSNNQIMNPDDQVYLESECRNPTLNIEIEITKPVLKFSGTACGSGGIPVPGADYCTFSPKGGIIYVEGVKQKASSYTVPYTPGSPTCILSWVEGRRHICGYKEESCSSDSDCGGHTYGNKECSGRTLQTYGCKSYGSEPESLTKISGGLLDTAGDSGGIKEDEIIPSSGKADFGRRCDIIRTRTVQCCGDSDCGSNMFCDRKTFTCQDDVECVEDSDCGVSIQCDWTSNLLKTPTCQEGKCVYKEQEVDCCLDKNCDNGSFCNENNECEDSVEGSQEYSKNENDHSNVTLPLSKEEPSKYLMVGGARFSIIIIPILLLLLGIGSLGGYFIFVRNKNDQSKDKKTTEVKPKCKKCGKPLKANAKFCTECGEKVE